MEPVSSARQFDISGERLNTYLAKPLTFSGRVRPYFPGIGGVRRNNRNGMNNLLCFSRHFSLLPRPQKMSIQNQIVWSIPFLRPLGCVMQVGC
jgi:hypothetical protein